MQHEVVQGFALFKRLTGRVRGCQMSIQMKSFVLTSNLRSFKAKPKHSCPEMNGMWHSQQHSRRQEASPCNAVMLDVRLG